MAKIWSPCPNITSSIRGVRANTGTSQTAPRPHTQVFDPAAQLNSPRAVFKNAELPAPHPNESEAPGVEPGASAFLEAPQMSLC